MFLMKENYRSLEILSSVYRKFAMQGDGRLKTNFNLSMALPNESAGFLYILYIFCNTLYTAAKKFQKEHVR